MSDEHKVITRLAVYRCSYAPDDRACGLFEAEETAPILGRPKTAFGYDASYDECNHTWPLADAEEVVVRWNAFAPPPAIQIPKIEVKRADPDRWMHEMQALVSERTRGGG